LPDGMFAGRVLADASVFISCTMVLAVSTDLGDIFIDIDQSTGTISHSSVFKCSISLRSDRAVALIQADKRR
ncbi:hypothetical protein BT96DRAFT_828252, partial [Gymnopus androsaceus JB14]